jgi:S1-C subfamily serine protease
MTIGRGLFGLLSSLSVVCIADTATATSANQDSLWIYNDSVMYLVAEGQVREFRYQEPRPALIPFGVTRGTLAFRGFFRDGEYVGTAFTFSRECGALAFSVRGPILDNGKRILLEGRLPKVDAWCRNIGSVDHELEFRGLKGPIDKWPPDPPELPTTSISGSGVVIAAHGEVLTNAHVVENCTNISVRPSSAAPAYLVARDERNDLAVVRSNLPLSSVVVFRDGRPVRAGDRVVALGYPLSGILAPTASLSVGNVSALAGLRGDSRFLQISAPVQPGNSGGPLLDASGHLVGIVTGKLNAAVVPGHIPENVNFALKAEVARTFLDSQGITYQTARSEQQLSESDVGEIGRPFTVQIQCEQAPDQARK